MNTETPRTPREEGEWRKVNAQTQRRADGGLDSLLFWSGCAFGSLSLYAFALCILLSLGVLGVSAFNENRSDGAWPSRSQVDGATVTSTYLLVGWLEIAAVLPRGTRGLPSGK